MIFESGSREERAYRSCRDQAISHAGGLALPVSARTLTRAEAVARDGNKAFLLYILGLFAALVGLALILQSGDPWPRKVAWAVLLAMVGYAMFLVARAHERRRSAYADPEIVVDVTDDGISVRNPAGTHRLPDDALRWEFFHLSNDGGVIFMGIRLDTPLGRLELYDEHFVGGRNAAAAIALRAEREKVEGGILRAG